MRFYLISSLLNPLVMRGGRMKVGVSLSAFVKETARQTVNAGNLDHLTSWPHTNKESRKATKVLQPRKEQACRSSIQAWIQDICGRDLKSSKLQNAQHYFARGADKCQCCVCSE